MKTLLKILTCWVIIQYDMIRVGINGFGRIGRNVMRAILERGNHDINVTRVNDLGELHTNLHLLKYDSAHGRLNTETFVYPEGDCKPNSKVGTWFRLGNDNLYHNKIWYTRQRDLTDWNVDVLIDCTGIHTDGDVFRNNTHRTIISAPAKNVDRTVVYGINHKDITEDDQVISNASCTTNCIAWLADIVHKNFGLRNGFMNTVHAYTSDQVLVDSYHNDRYRARSAANNIIPTKTGAAETVAKILPALEGRLTGFATRVPVQNVSMLDFTFTTERPCTKIEIKDRLWARENEYFGFEIDKCVSSDYMGDPRSCIVDWNQYQTLDEYSHRLDARYDNEWTCANRIVDLIEYVKRF